MQRTFALLVLAAIALMGCDRPEAPPATPSSTIDPKPEAASTTAPTPAATSTIAVPRALETPTAAPAPVPIVIGPPPVCGQPVPPNAQPVPAGVPRPIPLAKANARWVRVTPEEMKSLFPEWTTLYLVEHDELWWVRSGKLNRPYRLVRGTAFGTNRTLGFAPSDATNEAETVIVDLASREVFLLLPSTPTTRDWGGVGVSNFSMGQFPVYIDGAYDQAGGWWASGTYEIDLASCSATLVVTNSTEHYVLPRPLSLNAPLPEATVVEIRRGGPAPGVDLLGPTGARHPLYQGPSRVDLAPDRTRALLVRPDRMIEYLDFATGTTYDLGRHLPFDGRRPSGALLAVDTWSPEGRYVALLAPDLTVYDTMGAGAPRKVGGIAANGLPESWGWLDGDAGVVYRDKVRDTAMLLLPGGDEVWLSRGWPVERPCPGGNFWAVEGHGIQGVSLYARATGQRLSTPAIENIGEYYVGCSSDERWLLLDWVGPHD